MQRNNRNGCILLRVLLCIAALTPRGANAGGFEPVAACAGNANLLLQAVLRYAQDHETYFPPMDTPAHFQAAVGPYVANPSMYICPETNQPYALNAGLSNKSIAAVPETAIVFQDSQRHSDGSLIVAFADFHIEVSGVEVGDPRQLCIDRERWLLLGTTEYVQDHNGVFPPMGDPAQFKAAIFPYVQRQRYFTSPITNQPIQPNPALSGVSQSSLAGDPSQIWVVRDNGRPPEWVATVMYLDQHVQQTGLVTPMPSSGLNIRQLTYGVSQYMQDNELVVPPMSPYSAFQSAILPYVKNPALFLNPDRQLPYVLNTALNGHKLDDFPNPSTVEFMRDPAINFDGSINIGYLDGHVSPLLFYLNDGLALDPGNATELFWNKLDGTAALWSLSSVGDQTGAVSLGSAGGRIVGLAIGSDHLTRVLRADGNSALLLTLSAFGVVQTQHNFGPYSGWTAVAMALGPNNQPCLLWTRFDGAVAVWFMTTDGQYLGAVEFNMPPPWVRAGFGPGRAWSAVAIAADWNNDIRVLGEFSDGTATSGTIPLHTKRYILTTTVSSEGQQPIAVAIGPDNLEYFLRAGRDGSATILSLNPIGYVAKTLTLAPRSGSVARGLQIGADGLYRVLWRNNDDSSRLQVLTKAGAIVSTHDYAPY